MSSSSAVIDNKRASPLPAIPVSGLGAFHLALSEQALGGTTTTTPGSRPAAPPSPNAPASPDSPAAFPMPPCPASSLVFDFPPAARPPTCVSPPEDCPASPARAFDAPPPLIAGACASEPEEQAAASARVALSTVKVRRFILQGHSCNFAA